MSILIKGMKMPYLSIVLCIHPDGKVFADIDGEWKEYKAVELPPHGRLIDADAFLAKLKKDPLFPLVEKYGMSGVIEAQPTILPAKEVQND